MGKTFQERQSERELAKASRRVPRESHGSTMADAFILAELALESKEMQEQPEPERQSDSELLISNEITLGPVPEDIALEPQSLNETDNSPALFLPGYRTKPPAMQSLPIPFPTARDSGQQASIPSQVGSSQSTQQRPLRPQPDRGPEEMPKPPVPLTEEQQTLCAWIYLRRQIKAEKYLDQRERLYLINQILSIGIGILSIVGGVLAIRNGLNAAAKDY